MRSRSTSIAATSMYVMRASDPEEEVEIPVGDGPLASDRAGVAPAERREDEASRVELQCGDVIDRPGFVREALLADRHPRVTGVRSGGDADPDLARVRWRDGVGGVL